MLVTSSIADARCTPIALTNTRRMGDSRTDEIRGEIQATRIRRLFEFRERFDTDADAAKALGVNPGYFSQFKLKKPNKGKRGIGEVVARRMEETAGLPRYWFDDIVPSDQTLSYREYRIIEAFRHLPDAAQNEWEGLLLRLASVSAADDPPTSTPTPRLRTIR